MKKAALKTFTRAVLTGLALLAMATAAEAKNESPLKPAVKTSAKSGAASAGTKKSADAALFAEEAAGNDVEAKLIVGTNEPVKTDVATLAGGLPTVASPTVTSAVSSAVAPASALPKVEVNKLPENEIPVLANVKESKKAEGGTLYRLMATLGVLAVGLGAASYGLKKWMAKSPKTKDNTRIKLLTQHHLGPKKSLTIIQVAGETLLLGVTDQNITMLKTLSLLGDEIPDAVPTNFDTAMGDFDEDHADEHVSDDGSPDEDFTISGLSEVRDRISTRMKGMRRL